MTPNRPTLSFSLLSRQNAETSKAIIEAYGEEDRFVRLARFEGRLTEDRDRQDDEKLQVGIDIARAKGVIDPDLVPAPYRAIDVLGKTPDQVADLILQQVQEATGTGGPVPTSSGFVVVLVGKSGTGKGTTVAQLVKKLSAQGQSVVTWSNGNVFRVLTLLATNHAQAQDMRLEQVLTKELLSSFMEQISIHTQAPGDSAASSDGPCFDIIIDGIGSVNEIQNTLLKSPVVSQNIPTVAEATQGEVILFCSRALRTLAEQGVVVLLEGRAPTVNYVPTPHRFELVLSDGSLIGQRRAAQRMFAQAYQQLLTVQTQTNGDDGTIDSALVQQTLDQVLSDLVQEIP